MTDLPNARPEERIIAATLIELGPELWDEMAGLTVGDFSDTEVKNILKQMAKRKQKGRDWFPGDFPYVTDTAGNQITPTTSVHFFELVKRVKDASFRRKALEVGKSIATAAVGDDMDKLRKSLDPLHLPTYSLADGKTPATWAEQAAIVPKITWLWDKWLPVGLISMNVGAPEIGKSSLSLIMARSVITGSAWPDGTLSDGGGKVVWYDTENAEAINHERARMWGIPLDSILVPALEHDPLSEVDVRDPEGWAAFEMAARAPDVKLVVIDSLGGAWLKENDPDVKLLVKKLGALARDAQVAMLIVHHPRKLHLGEHDTLTIDRVRGHSGIVQFARVIWGLEKPDPGLPDTVRCKVIKSNLGKKPLPFGFEITGDGLTWDDAPEEVKQETQQDKAADLLRAILNSGPLPATEVYEEAKGAGISEATVKRAKTVMKIVSKREDDRWFWALPGHRNLEPYIPEN